MSNQLKLHPSQPNETTGNRKTLLLVDSDPLLRWSVATHLRRWFDIRAVEAPENADAVLRRQRFDGLVIAVNGHGDGGAIEAAARQANPNVAIVRLVTDTEAAGKEEPGVVCLEKPFRLDALSRALGIIEPVQG